MQTLLFSVTSPSSLSLPYANVSPKGCVCVSKSNQQQCLELRCFWLTVPDK